MIDAHVHLWTRELAGRSAAARDAFAYFRTPAEAVPTDLEGIVEALTSAKVERAFLLAMSCEASADEALRNLTVPNAEVAAAFREHPDLFAGFAGVDPRRGAKAVEEVRRAAKLGFVGLKFHASTLETYPNDETLMYPLYRAAQDAGLRILHHTGTTALGHCRIKYTRPLYLDDVAEDFPDLKILAAHFGWPWMDECFSVLMRHPNVYMDLSGWGPRYLPEGAVAMANGPFRDRTLAGSDFPMMSPGPWQAEFEKAVAPKLKEGVAAKILRENAKRFLA